MTRLRTLSLLSIALVGLTACGMAEGAMDSDSDEGVFLITHTTKGTLYWE
jgi:hypothetical protein